MLCDDVHDNGTRTVTTIERLCDNVLLEVFKHLNAKDLKNASLVDRRWNELIGSSALTMKKFRFRIKDERHSNRNHQNFVIKTTETTDWATIAGSIRLGSVRSFHLQGGRYYDTIDCDALFTFLTHLTELDEVIFENMRLIDETDSIVKKIELPQLNTLRVIGVDFTILKHIDAKALHQLQCIANNCNSLTLTTDFEWIAESIVRFSRIQSLTLWNCMEAFEHIDVQQIKFHLQSFEVYHINVSPIDVSAFEHNLRQFLLLQADSLRDLKFDCSMFDVDVGHRMVNDFLRTAFNSCTSLTSLDIRNLSIPRDGCFYQSLSPNYSIRNLQVHWGFDGEVVEGVLKLCPKLTKLEADMCHLSGDGLSTIAAFSPELIYLHTFKLTGRIDSDTTFEQLTYLSVSKIEFTSEPLLDLMARCPKMEQIRVDECRCTELVMDAVLRSSTMKRLRIADKCYDILGESHEDGDERIVLRESE
ncbi:hypothetical protein HA402_006551 [Bradysia odoriphaga]|nr:hypothetical protein HA402_006551 [Bradysia odoriphaga]